MISTMQSFQGHTQKRQFHGSANCCLKCLTMGRRLMFSDESAKFTYLKNNIVHLLLGHLMLSGINIS
jgi:hypothetical protein